MTYEEIKEVFNMYKASIEAKTGEPYTKQTIDESMSNDALLNVLIAVEADSKAA